MFSHGKVTKLCDASPPDESIEVPAARPGCMQQGGDGNEATTAPVRVDVDELLEGADAADSAGAADSADADEDVQDTDMEAGGIRGDEEGEVQ